MPALDMQWKDEKNETPLPERLGDKAAIMGGDLHCTDFMYGSPRKKLESFGGSA